MKTWLLVMVMALLSIPVVSFGQESVDQPTLTPAVVGQAKIEVTVTAGASGAPGGFTVCWMRLTDYQANGNRWAEPGDPRLMTASFVGAPTVNTAAGAISSFSLGPHQTVTVELGDLFDETGVITNATDELAPSDSYVIRGYANADGTMSASATTAATSSNTLAPQNCTYTQGYWKNHPEAWPVMSLKLGLVTYTKPQLLAILGESAKGNGLLILAHQLIAAKLNVANGAEPTLVASAINQADALIGNLICPPIGTGQISPSNANALAQLFDNWNNGVTGPGHCGATPAKPTTWGELKALYR